MDTGKKYEENKPTNVGQKERDETFFFAGKKTSYKMLETLRCDRKMADMAMIMFGCLYRYGTYNKQISA